MDLMTSETPDIVVEGGMLALNPDTGIAGCMHCGWRGVPNFVGGKRIAPQRRAQNPATGAWEIRGAPVDGSRPSTYCPVCESDMGAIIVELDAERAARRAPLPKAPRNAPCPCGSGVKAKKCDCGRYAC